MKPAPFDYVAVDTWDAALAEVTTGAMVLAGGQSLVPLLNLRLVRPARLVDINAIPGLIRRTDGVLRIGATVRQAALERSQLVSAGWPLLAQAVRHVGHPATRSRGTIGGSVAHADPRAELICALTALDARYEVAAAPPARGSASPAPISPARGAASPGPAAPTSPAVAGSPADAASPALATRIVAGPLVLGPGELLVSVELPPLPPGARTAFAEYARTRGDFAEAAVAVVRAPERAAIAVLGAGRAVDAEAALRAGAADETVAQLAAGLVDGDHPRALVAELTRRALAEAVPA